jgi:hypothetical protein
MGSSSFTGGGLDTSNKTLTTYYHDSEWKSYRDYVDDLKLLAKNKNNEMMRDVDVALEPYGYEISLDKDHDFNPGTGSFTFHLKEI